VNPMLIGLATYIVKSAFGSCFTEKTSRVPKWMPEVEPISDSWKVPMDKFVKGIKARQDLRSLEQRAEKLLLEIEAEYGLSS